MSSDLVPYNSFQQESEEAIIGKVISMPDGASPSFLQIHIRLVSNTPSLKPGAWVSVEAKSQDDQLRRIICRVINTWENNPHEDAVSSLVSEVLPFKTEYALEGESTVIYRITEVEPMEEVTFDTISDDLVIGEVSTLPKAGANVYLASEEMIIKSLGLEEDVELGIDIGTLRDSGNPPARAIIKRSAIQRHIFIGGGIGSGKSYTRGVLAEELHMLGVPQINIDVNGEMIEATKQLKGINLIPGEKGFTLPLSSLTPNDVIEAIPGLRQGTNIQELIENAHADLLKERSNPNHELYSQSFGVSELIDKINEIAPRLNMEAPKTLYPATQRARSLENIPYIGKPFDWESHIKPGAIINIDCRGLLVSDLRLIVASVARDLQRIARKKTHLFVAFSIDEFHLVAPNDDKSVTTQVLREIARIGRHYKIGLILTTQSPQDVDRSILKRLLTRFLHAIEPDQLEALRGVFSDASPTLIKSLPKLQQGSCIVTGAFETIRHASIVDIRQRRTVHEGKSPDIWSDFQYHGWNGKKELELKDVSDESQ
jgi:hypothetical protein